MKNLLIIVLIIFGTYFQTTAKEGMWIPMLLQKLNADDMQAEGMKISAEDIYSVNQSSLKDAIVHFGGGCTAEIVSKKGLVLTNHHCGYSSIQKHSSVEHDYLTDGFWSQKMSDELKNPGLTAKILTNMQDVSDEVLDGVTATMTEKEREAQIALNIESIKKNHDNSKFHKVDIKAFYYGNQYIMMEYMVFHDVRLVGAPPSNIGKFGGDTDNWMWPRHTGDFSVFRLYANADNQPADISEDNVPYQPRQALKISLNGVNEGDFTFIFGYPGRTQEYIPASQVKYITEVQNPFKINLRRQKLDIMNAEMDKDKNIRIQYSSKYAGVANGWKKWIGENKGIALNNAVDKKKSFESKFLFWGEENDEPSKDALPEQDALIKEMEPYNMAYTYFVEAAYYHDLTRFAHGFNNLIESSKNENITDEDFAKQLENTKIGIKSFYKDYNEVVDKNIFIASLKAYYAFPYKNIKLPDFFSVLSKKYNGSVEKYADMIYKKSVFANQQTMEKFIAKANRKNLKKLAKDPLLTYATDVFDYFFNDIRPELNKLQMRKDSLQRIYMAGIIKFRVSEKVYPDANSTLRIAYGKVEGFEPRDGVEYTYFTTLKGIMAKENPDIYDYVVEPKLKQLYQNKDYGQYGDKDGSMHVCFIGSNHTTGGNSGSPALDANGNLIGINFDRNWEGTMSDLNYDPNQCRNIMLDIRYCLFIIDKFAEDHRLIEEMEFVN
jgi:hypothetical protein